MKLRILRVVTTLLFWGLAAGCNATATGTPGEFVSNVEGTYDLAVITNSLSCTPYFDPVVTVVQDEDRFTILADNTGYDDMLGVFDDGETSTYTLTGSGRECTGSFVSGLLSSVCNVTLVTCSTDESTGEQTCSDQTFSCQLTYERR